MYANSINQVWRPHTSVKLRFAFVQGVLIAAIISLLAVTLGYSARSYLVTTTDNSYKILANDLAAGIFPFYSTNETATDQRQIASTVHTVEDQQGVKFVLITDDANKVIYDSYNTLQGKTLNDAITKATAANTGELVKATIVRPDDSVSYYEYASPFISGDKVAYTVRLGVDEASVDGQFDSLARNFIYTGVIGILIGVVVAYFLSARLTRPIISLTESALAIRAGNLNAYPDVRTNDELEQLSREFQSMVEKLKGFYFQEYTQKKEALNAKTRLEEINGRLEELDRQKTDFLNAASHQLRTPLSIIHWSLSLIVDDLAHMQLKPEQQELLTEALKSTKRMVDLVNDLLDVSRIEQGRMELAWAKGNFGTVCQNLVTALQPLAQKKSLQLTYEQVGTIPDSFLDEQKFYQVINNFVDNAIKYTAQGWVKVTCTQEGDHVAIRISDSGIGMTDEERNRLFTRFVRGGDASKMNANGSGLGMFVAKTMLAQHGGDIAVDSAKGQGTTFTLTLPLYAEEPKAASSSTEQLGGTSGSLTHSHA